MNRTQKFSFIAAMAIILTGASTLPAAPQSDASATKPAAAPKGDAANGKKLWDAIGCYQCHGYSAQGGAGPRLAPPAIPFAGLKYIRAPKGDMPPYTEKVVPEQQLADIYAFLQTISKPPDPKTIPLLNKE